MQESKINKAESILLQERLYTLSILLKRTSVFYYLKRKIIVIPSYQTAPQQKSQNILNGLRPL